MKNQALFSSKDKSKKLKCRLLQFLFGTLRVKLCISLVTTSLHITFLLHISHFRTKILSAVQIITIMILNVWIITLKKQFDYQASH